MALHAVRLLRPWVSLRKIDSSRSAPRSIAQQVEVRASTSARDQLRPQRRRGARRAAAPRRPASRTTLAAGDAAARRATRRVARGAPAPATSTSTVAAAAEPLGQLLLGALRDDLPVLDHQQAVAGLADLRRGCGWRPSTVCAPRRLRISVAHLDDLHRVEAAGRLVEDQQRRACAPAPAPRPTRCR